MCSNCYTQCSCFGKLQLGYLQPGRNNSSGLNSCSGWNFFPVIESAIFMGIWDFIGRVKIFCCRYMSKQYESLFSRGKTVFSGFWRHLTSLLLYSASSFDFVVNNSSKKVQKAILRTEAKTQGLFSVFICLFFFFLVKQLTVFISVFLLI